MKTKILLFILFLTSAIVISALTGCKTTPPPVEEQPNQAAAAGSAGEPADFNPQTISKDIFDSTKLDVQRLITDLNEIIRRKDYKTWTSYLSEKYFAMISSREFLAERSESPLLKKNKVVLKTPEDYFNIVVVPSRANDHVEDIEFLGQNNVKAYTIDRNGSKVRLYDLEKINGEWKIAN